MLFHQDGRRLARAIHADPKKLALHLEAVHFALRTISPPPQEEWWSYNVTSEIMPAFRAANTGDACILGCALHTPEDMGKLRKGMLPNAKIHRIQPQEEVQSSVLSRLSRKKS